MNDPRLSDRQNDILVRIGARGAQQIDRLAREYGLTTQSIRRDINLLCELGLARRLHGGVDLPVLPQNTSINARASLHGGAKRLIAARVAQDIPDGSTVFMGIGTTVRFTAEALRGHSGLTVVTNNVDVALTLGDVEGIELHLAGGVWRANDRDLVGADTIRYFEKFHATHAVVGTGGLHPTSGALDFSYEESQITNAILQNSRTRYLVADVSKWSGTAAVRVAPFSEFTAFVTDRMPLEQKNEESLRQSGVQVIVCGTPDS
ncbi:DeoR/GlpR family DNA-binding transcription regulator [Devosia neptuniae]|uniref:DeoR/GlpR family DNA-binding transcription regulator n=1 Tax=Devosia neptuniae TaxID=191302 RepID=A0ABY6CII4_9HYPH|nr:DeoR/GlpR family DNA-binding transcription regulator [Devosia neptuniae]UXN72035.1 DeoR/GlpR family DNA-binding transcription regulator [Devosia neptuniae]